MQTDTFCFSQHVLTKEETYKILSEYDLDEDGLLNFDEFVEFAKDKILLEDYLKDLRVCLLQTSNLMF